VSLETGLSLDDHATVPGARPGAVHSITSMVTPATNLAVQTAVLANAGAFVGTYGGFSYLPPMHGVPAIGLYSLPFGFDRLHLHVAQQAFARVRAPRFDVRDIHETTPEALAGLVAGLR